VIRVELAVELHEDRVRLHELVRHCAEVVSFLVRFPEAAMSVRDELWGSVERVKVVGKPRPTPKIATFIGVLGNLPPTSSGPVVVLTEEGLDFVVAGIAGRREPELQEAPKDAHLAMMFQP
jgi:hypothetical protein